MTVKLLKKTPAFIWHIKHWYLMTDAWCLRYRSNSHDFSLLGSRGFVCWWHTSDLYKFKLKLLPAPGEVTFEICYIKYREIGPRKKVVALVFEAKMRKMIFFFIFLNQIIFFCYGLEFYIISAFIWGISCISS